MEQPSVRNVGSNDRYDGINWNRPGCVRRAPQTPAVNNAQWAPPPSTSSVSGGAQTPYNGLKDFHPYQQTQPHMTQLQPLQAMQMTPMQQYGYDAATQLQMAAPYPQVSPVAGKTNPNVT